MSEGTKVVDSPRTLVEGQRLDQPTFHALYYPGKEVPHAAAY